MFVVERAVEAQDGTPVGIRLEGRRVRVRWGCTSRTFTPDDLRLAIDNIRLLRDHRDVRMRMLDSNQAAFFVALDEEGILHADTNPQHLHASGNGAVAGANAIPWRQLRKALSKGLEDLAKRDPPEDDDVDDDDDMD